MRRLILPILLLLAGTLPAQKPGEIPSLDLYYYVQARRERADTLAQAGKTGEALALLRATIDSLKSPGVLLMAQGWSPLQSRTANVEYDVMMIQLQQGDTTAAVTTFRRVVRAGGGPVYLDFLKQDSTRLPALRRWPAFRQLELELTRTRDRWNNTAFAAPWTSQLSQAERVAGLSVVWAEARHGYIDFRRIPELDWDSLYVATIDEVIRTPDTWEYYKVIRRFIARLRDSHTNLSLPAAIVDSLWTRPAIETRKVEDEVVVIEVADPAVSALGVKRGDRIAAIDGIPVERYVADSVDPYVAWASPQDRAVRDYFYELLRGPRDRPVRLTLVTGNAAPRTVSVPRRRSAGITPVPMVEARRIEGDLAFVSLRSMDDERYVAQFDSALASLGAVKGVIIDVRDNGGGNSSIGWNILARFLKAPVPLSLAEGMTYSALERARGRIATAPIFSTLDSMPPDSARHLDLPLVVLIGPKSFSAAEDFAVVVDQAGVPLIGMPTGGSTGQPMSFRLPGGVWARVRAKHDTYADGREFIGIGIQPTIRVPETLAALRAGRDEALERAVAYLRGR